MKCLLFFMVLTTIICRAVADEDLYKILGVSKSASSTEIKKAYKKLAVQWHPDKNPNDPEANAKFIKMNEAYETLSDTEKRRDYDEFGSTSAQQGPQRHGRSPFGDFDPFEEFFGDGHFSFFGQRRTVQNPLIEKYKISLRYYQTSVLDESRKRPYLIYVYANNCFPCMKVNDIWEKVVRDLETIGMGIGTVNIYHERGLTKKLKVSSVPTLLGIINGKRYFFSGQVFTIEKIRQFIRGLFPLYFITEVNDENYKHFLGSWKDNKARMIFADDRKEPSLRFVLAAYANRDRVAPGFVNSVSYSTSNAFYYKYNIQSNMETLLMFQEDMKTPAAQVTMKTLSRSTIDEMIAAKKYLQLPRLSSQHIFNELCPLYSNQRKKKLCVVLLTRDIPEHDHYISKFREYAHSHSDPQDRVRYAYMWQETQAHFINELTRGQGISNDTTHALKVALLWRRDPVKLMFDWLEDGWFLHGKDAQRSQRKLRQKVDWLLESSEILPHVMDVSTHLVDEHAENLFWRILQRLRDWYDFAYDTVISMDEITIISVATTVTFVIVIGVFVRTMVNLEENTVKHKRTTGNQRKPKETPRPPVVQPSSEPRTTIYLHPLCPENFSKLILDTEPGTRSIIILVSQQSQQKILQQFGLVVNYFRTNAFLFGFLQLEQYLFWYRHLLEHTLDFRRDLSGINMNNCLGTVLAINGPKKYYCIYHASTLRRRQTNAASGAFIGFGDSDNDSDSDVDAKKLFEADLLGQLGVWMEKLVEGTLRRYRVEYWPEMS